VMALLLGVDGHAPYVLLPLSAVGTAAFLFVELRAKEPLLPLPMFKRRIFATSSALSALSGGAMLGLVTFVPLYAQGVLGTTPTKAGSMVAAMAVAWPVASAISGRLIVKIGFKALVRTGYGITGVASLLLLFFVTHSAGATELRIASAMFGLGMGLATAPIVIGVQTSVAFAQRGVATASTMFFRNIGGTVGVGVMGVVLADALLAGPAKEAGGAGLVAQILGPERRNLDPGLLASISGDLGVGVVHVLWVIAAMSLTAAVLAWLYPGPTPVDET
jgi:predicted MFS family arabinose efflux permease